MSLKNYSRDEVSLHNTDKDCWMIYKNKVFDVTSFISEHPAGPDYIIDYAGVDTTAAFDDVGHSQDAMKWMLKYHIGDIASNEQKEEDDTVVTDISKKWTHVSQLTKKKQVSHNSYVFTFKFTEAVDF